MHADERFVVDDAIMQPAGWLTMAGKRVKIYRETQQIGIKPYRDRFDRGSLAFLLGTFVAAAIAAIAAVYAAVFTYQQVEVAQESLKALRASSETNLRAWIAPGDIVITDDFVKGDSNEIYLTFGNIGKSPAYKVTMSIENFILPKRLIHDVDAIRIAIESRTRCKTLEPSEIGFVSFPSGDLDSRVRRLPTPDQRKQLLAAKDYFFIAGCFVYESFGNARISKFCRFLDYNEGRGPKNWPSTYCNFREFAD